MSDEKPLISRRSGLIIDPSNGRQAKIVEEGFTPGLVKKPHIDIMLADAYVIIHKELAGLRNKVLAGDTLTESESRRMANLTGQLVKLAAEEREQQKQDRLDDLDDDQLLSQAKEAIEVIGRK